MITQRREQVEAFDTFIRNALHIALVGVKPSSSSWINVENKLCWLQVKMEQHKHKIFEPHAVSHLSVKTKGFYPFIPGLFLV